MLPFQLSAGPSAGEGRWAPPHQEPRAGLFAVAPGHPGAGSSLALSGLGAGWQFRFLRRLAGPGLGEPELAPRAARRGGRTLKAKVGRPGWLHGTPRGGEELGLGERDFLASWARLLGAWPHKAPFVAGPAPAQTRVSEQ